MGIPGGLQVTLVDGELISATNCVRQPFCRSEIGLHKCTVLVNRLNLFWGLEWEAIPEHLSAGSRIDEMQIVVGCVDSRAARKAIRQWTSGYSRVHYWLDLGNNSDGGQFVLGEPLNCMTNTSIESRAILPQSDSGRVADDSPRDSGATRRKAAFCVVLKASGGLSENLTEIAECGFLKSCHPPTPCHGWRALTRRWPGRRNTSIRSMPKLVCSSKAPSGISF